MPPDMKHIFLTNMNVKVYSWSITFRSAATNLRDVSFKGAVPRKLQIQKRFTEEADFKTIIPLNLLPHCET